jgi:hypothetical protein
MMFNKTCLGSFDWQCALKAPAFGQMTAAPEQVKKGRLRSFLLAPRLRQTIMVAMSLSDGGTA